MHRAEIKSALLSMVVLFFSCTSSADPVLAIVDAKEIKDSGITASKLCDEEKNCNTWETYIIYKAKIRKVLHGSMPVDDIVIAKGQHTGYVNKKINSWMVLIQKIEDPVFAQKLGAQYIIVQSSFPEKYYCFDGKPSDVIDKLFILKLASSSEDYFCYSLDDLPETE